MSELNYKKIGEDLFSAVLCDILDELGYRDQAMDKSIRPISEDFKVCGPAFTIQGAGVAAPSEEPFKVEFAAIDSIHEGEVLVIDAGNAVCGFWGELLSATSRHHGAVGCVMDGLTRDTKRIISMNFPVFATGYNPLDCLGRGEMIAYQRTVCVGGVNVHPGDMIFGDVDGIVVVPAAVAEECVERAYKKVEDEKMVKGEFLSGRTASEVWNQYHIL